jgi:hypothetical protein
MDKILKIQTEIGTLVKTENNPFFKSKYLDINALLEQLQPLLATHELTVVQPLKIVDGKSALFTFVMDGDKTLVESSILLPELQDPQKIGSVITYYRRYALQSLFLLRAEDDDANKASENKPKKETLTNNSEPF